MSRKTKRTPSPPTPRRKEVPRPLRGIGDTPDGQHPAWRLSLLDREHDGEWSWSINDPTRVEIIGFLSEMERLTWTEVRAQMAGGNRRRGEKHKAIPVEHLCGEAQRRVQELRLEEFDELFRFRVGGTKRLWGVVYDDVFYPLWWDPDHKVCPGQDR